jgi:hypothetical protein
MRSLFGLLALVYLFATFTHSDKAQDLQYVKHAYTSLQTYLDSMSNVGVS